MSNPISDTRKEEGEETDKASFSGGQKPRIIFLTVKDNNSKLKAICDIAAELFLAGKRLLIAAPNQQAAVFVDGLLWKLPEEGFLPHVLTNSKTDERCAITTQQTNCNAATNLLNLCPSVPDNFSDFDTIYELWDETDPAKTALSANRKKAYEENITANFKIEIWSAGTCHRSV